MLSPLLLCTGSLTPARAAEPRSKAGDPHTAAPAGPVIEQLANDALAAYNAKDLNTAYVLYSSIIEKEPGNPVWLERRGQVLVDLKRFPQAVDDFNQSERLYRETIDEQYYSLGLLSNRALAYEGLYQWDSAIADYNVALKLSSQLGYSIPYVLNSRGNCHASLAASALKGDAQLVSSVREEWNRAQSDYQEAARTFQKARNLPGAIFASSNAALISAQLGDDIKALRELKNVARRAPGSIDMRAAIAAIYWAAGEEALAEQYWGWACEKINSGQLVEGGPVLDSCEKYGDPDWLGRIRRWPPVMVDRMTDFLKLKPSRAPAVLVTRNA